MKKNQNGISIVEIMLFLIIVMFIIFGLITLLSFSKKQSHINEIAEEIQKNNAKNTLITMKDGVYTLKTEEQRQLFCEDPLYFLKSMKEHEVLSSFKKNDNEYITLAPKAFTYEELQAYWVPYCNKSPNSPTLSLQVNKDSNTTSNSEFKKPDNKWQSTEAL